MPSTPNRIVIVGGGLAAGKAAEALRAQGYDQALTVISDEAHLPYERPPLSKSYLAGTTTFDDAFVHPESWYADNHVDLRLGTRADEVDLAGHAVRLADGSRLPYDKLLLATGSTPRRLPLPGADADGVFTLRTREDSDAIRATFGAGRRLVIIGAGWIGLETAAAARQAGTEVSVVEVADLPLLNVLGPEMATVFADLHRAHGVDLRLGGRLADITVTDGRATGVALADGSQLAADAVVIGVGVTPNVELAEAAGLSVDNGVLVDAALRTTDPDVYAVGDIANHDHPLLGRIRVEHWATALNQPAVAAAAMLGHDAAYEELPYFFTDQYDLGMEYIGHSGLGRYRQVVVRGDVAGREFVAFWLDGDDRVRAAMAVNVWDVIDEIKPLIAERLVVEPGELADPDVPYAKLGR